MHAVIKTGGKQYRVQAGDEFNIEKLPGAEKGSQIVFEEILAVGDGDGLKIGQPFLAGATVEGKVVTNGRTRKIVIFKKKRRKNYMVKRGHRQHFTRVLITEIKA